MRQRSYCFMNAFEKDNSKLIPVPVSDDDTIQVKAAFAVLTDVWVATHSVMHISVGCGSNVDKLIYVLRPHDPDTTMCFDIKKICQGPGCVLRKCHINPDPGVLGLNCSLSFVGE